MAGHARGRQAAWGTVAVAAALVTFGAATSANQPSDQALDGAEASRRSTPDADGLSGRAGTDDPRSRLPLPTGTRLPGISRGGLGPLVPDTRDPATGGDEPGASAGPGEGSGGSDEPPVALGPTLTPEDEAPTGNADEHARREPAPVVTDETSDGSTADSTAESTDEPTRERPAVADLGPPAPPREESSPGPARPAPSVEAPDAPVPGPVPAEPVPAEPVPAEPVPAVPVPAVPAPEGPAPVEPAPSAPAPIGPEPIAPVPVVPKPADAEPAVPQPIPSIPVQPPAPLQQPAPEEPAAPLPAAPQPPEPQPPASLPAPQAPVQEPAPEPVVPSPSAPTEPPAATPEPDVTAGSPDAAASAASTTAPTVVGRVLDGLLPDVASVTPGGRHRAPGPAVGPGGRLVLPETLLELATRAVGRG